MGPNAVQTASTTKKSLFRLTECPRITNNQPHSLFVTPGGRSVPGSYCSSLPGELSPVVRPCTSLKTGQNMMRFTVKVFGLSSANQPTESIPYRSPFPAKQESHSLPVIQQCRKDVNQSVSLVQTHKGATSKQWKHSEAKSAPFDTWLRSLLHNAEKQVLSCFDGLFTSHWATCWCCLRVSAL